MSSFHTELVLQPVTYEGRSSRVSLGSFWTLAVEGVVSQAAGPAPGEAHWTQPWETLVSSSLAGRDL
jgi:hypothetical protein